MVAKKGLVAYVYINGDLYGPDDDVPAEVAEQITNPKAWGDEPQPEESKAAAKKATTSKTQK